MAEEIKKDTIRGGRVLKEARVAQGLSLDTVHAATKIPLDALKSIEEGYKVRTLTPFYIKGFMKIYAQYLGVDIKKVLTDFQPERLPPPMPKEGGDLDFEELTSRIPREKMRQIVKIAGAIILLLIVVKVGSGIFRKKGEATPKDKKVQKAPEKKKTVVREKDTQKAAAAKSQSKKSEQTSKATAPAKTEPKPTATPVKVEEKEEQSPAVSKRVRLTIRAKNSGWLQVKADGNLVFQAILEEGQSETWEAEKIIELSGKNIHDLEFEVNGRLLGGLGREDRSARRVVVTAEGLTVKSTL